MPRREYARYGPTDEPGRTWSKLWAAVIYDDLAGAYQQLPLPGRPVIHMSPPLCLANDQRVSRGRAAIAEQVFFDVWSAAAEGS